MTPLSDDDEPQPSPGFHDQTVDFASEILQTPHEGLADRIRRLSPDMRASVLAEVVRRYCGLLRRGEETARELENLRYHARRLEDMLLQSGSGGDPRS